MPGRKAHIVWRPEDTEETWKRRYRTERHPQRKERAWAFWQPARGQRVSWVARHLGRSRNTLHRRIRRYNRGGWEEVARRTQGGRPGQRRSWLTPAQEAELRQAAAEGRSRTVWDVVHWVRERYGVSYTYKGMHAWLRRRGWRPKRPRPRAVKASEQAQGAWKKGG